MTRTWKTIPLTTLAMAAVLAGGIGAATAAQDSTLLLRDRSGALYERDSAGTWRPYQMQSRFERTPTVSRRSLPFTIEEYRAFDRASAPGST